MSKKNSFKSKIINIFGLLPKWKIPPKGMELTLKEWLMFAIGSLGCYGTITMMSFVFLQQGLYIAAACKINVSHVALIGIISGVIAILTTPLVSLLLDNTNTKLGKFRPYLLFMPIPMTICFFAIGQVVKIQDYMTLIIVYTVLFNIFNFFFRLYGTAYASISQVISPNMEERTQLMSIGLFFGSFGPTIVGILVPLLANSLYSTEGNSGNGLNQIEAYSWLIPVIATCFMAVGIFLALGVKERTVVSKNFKQRQNFVQGCKKTFQNKYFWIFNISNILGMMKLTLSFFILWYIIYDIAPALTAQNHGGIASAAQSIIATAIGAACVPGMLLSPYVIKKIGKKNLLLIVNFWIAIFAVPILLITNTWVHVACIFMITIAHGFQIVALPACQAVINDYQQYKTGDRIEGFLGQFGGIFFTVIGMGAAFIAPAVYKSFGYIENTDVLYNNDTLFGITRTMGAIGIFSALLSAIPFFFWDMTEIKHNGIMEILKVRAMCEDGNLDCESAQILEKSISEGDTYALNSYFASQENNITKIQNE